MRAAGVARVVAIALAAAGLGASAAAAQAPVRGGVLTELAGSDVDYLDPGHSYYTGGYQVIAATHRTLYSFVPGQPRTPVPDLALAAPEISPDRKTVTVRLRPGVRFAPPVGREVRASDVKYAMERAFSANVGGQYTVYFASISGAPARPTRGVVPISGIETPNDFTLVLRLTRPVGVSVAAALVLPITAPVPEEFARPLDRANPSAYESHVVATGPYMIPSDATGRLTGYEQGRSIRLVRNPNWNAATDFRPAYLDEIRIRTNEFDASAAGKRVLTGSHLIGDTTPPADVVRTLGRYPGQSTRVSAGGFRWFPLNTRLKPFTNRNVRKAIIAGFDRAAARRIRGGASAGPIATHFLPPDIPGFEEAGGSRAAVDFLRHPKGSLALARRYLRRAGYRTGRYTGRARIRVVSSNVDPGRAQGRLVKRQLGRLGFKVDLRLLPQDVAFPTCQRPARRIHICATAGWFKDFADAESMLLPTFGGSAITARGNNNLPQLRLPAIDRAMRAAALLDGPARARAWGAIDRRIVAEAPAIPFLWDVTTLIWSKDVSGAANPYTTAIDLSFTGLRG
jgi:peptide/nickel transport system substrate-binding protein